MELTVVEVKEDGFVLSDGRFFEFPIDMNVEELPSVEEMNEYYNHWKDILYGE